MMRLWYQDGPYAAYYHTGRYQDVINLAHTTLVNVDKPVLEETYYWRAMAKVALGDRERAIEDLRRVYALNPNSTPAGAELRRINALGTTRSTVAKPTRKAVWLSRVAKAAANSGASDEIDPSIRPARAGWTMLRTNARCSSEVPPEFVITCC